MLRLGGEVRLGEAMLCLGRSVYDQEGSQARLGEALFA